jgi:uncharacterized protein with HEPN domain
MNDLRTRIRLQDILGEIAGIREVTASLTFAEFDRSWATLRATQHALLIIGEAIKNLPPDIKARRPDIPWERIRVLGNFLRHEYASIDNARLWSIVEEQLDPLESAVRELLSASE